jgi:hypothetical protein
MLVHIVAKTRAKQMSISIFRRRTVLLVVAGLIGFATPAWAANRGWQTPYLFNVAAGQTTQQFGMNCPPDFPVVVSGAFAANAVGQTSQVSLSFNGPRIDENPPDLNAWGWHFDWPQGAPAGLTIKFDVYCVK